MATVRAPTIQQIRGDYLVESAAHALRYGRIFAAMRGTSTRTTRWGLVPRP